MEKSYSTKDFRLQMKENFNGFSLLLNKTNKIIKDKAVEEFSRKNSIGNIFIKEAKKIIKDGGTNISGYSWSYWERKKGERNFKAVRGSKVKNFSTSWRYRGSNRIRYPIHPRSYLRRKVKIKPIAGEFALYDSGTLYNSFHQVVVPKQDVIEVKILNTASNKLMKHEKGWVINGVYVIRPVLKPAWEKVERGGHMKLTINKVLKKIQKQLDSEFKKISG